MSARSLPDGRRRCVQYIEPPTGTGPCPQCSRAATHVLPDRPNVTTCAQHARSYDRPMTPEELNR